MYYILEVLGYTPGSRISYYCITILTEMASSALANRSLPFSPPLSLSAVVHRGAGGLLALEVEVLLVLVLLALVLLHGVGAVQI